MIKTIHTIIYSVFIVFVTVAISNAAVLIQSTESETTASNTLFTSNDVPIGSGKAGDFALLACVTTAEEPDQFSEPTPGDWLEVLMDTSAMDLSLIGVWGRFLDSPNAATVTCSWSDPESLFQGGVFRYSGVDTQSPIIDGACQKGEGNIATAPSVFAIPGSQLVRYVSATRFLNNDDDAVANTRFVGDPELSSSFFEGGSVPVHNRGLNLRGESTIWTSAGQTGTEDFTLNGFRQWVACSVSIRMAPRTIPTMSEWGFIAVAAFMGIAGIWYLRKKQTA